MMQPYNVTSSIQGDPLTFCFEVQGERFGKGKVFVYVNAPDVNAARARMAPLYRGCELIPITSTVIL